MRRGRPLKRVGKSQGLAKKIEVQLLTTNQTLQLFDPRLRPGQLGDGSRGPLGGRSRAGQGGPGGSLVAIFRLSPFLGPRRRFKPAAPWRRHAQRHSYNSFLAIPNSFETAAKASPNSKRLTTSCLNVVENKRTR